jgi:hypothetical protein
VSGLSAPARAAVFRASAGGPALALPSAPLGSLWLATLTSEPSDDGDGSALPEAAYGGYHRTALPYNLGWTLDESSTMFSNADPISLAPLTSGGPVQVDHWALCDAATDGMSWWSGAFTPVIIEPSDPDPVFPVGYLILYLSPGA